MKHSETARRADHSPCAFFPELFSSCKGDEPFCTFRGIRVATTLIEAISAALRHPQGGDVSITCAGQLASVYVFKGQIAWTICNAFPERLHEALQREAGLSRQQLREIFLRCKSTGETFAEAVLSSGLTDRDTLHRCLLLHNARHFHGIASLGIEIDASFTPNAREYSARFLYSFNDLLNAAADLSLRDAKRTGLAAQLEEALKKVALDIPGVQLLMLVDLESRSSLARWPYGYHQDDIRAELPQLCPDVVGNQSLAAFTGLAPADGSSRLNQAVLLAEDHLVFAEVLSDQVAGAIVCDDVSRLGFILARAGKMLRSRLQSISWPPLWTPEAKS